MVASSCACFLSPRPSPKVHDCRQHSSPSLGHALTSVASPTQPRAQNSNKLSSPSSRRTVRSCHALPFGFPSFGFPLFGSPSDAGQAFRGTASGNGNNADNHSSNVEGERSRHLEVPNTKCNGETDAGGSTAAAAAAAATDSLPVPSSPPLLPGSSPQQSARRRLSLPPLPFAQAAGAANSTSLVACDDANSQGTTEEHQQQQQKRQGAVFGSGSAAAAALSRRRASPLPYPWSPSDAEGYNDVSSGANDGCGAVMELHEGDGGLEGLAGGPKAELDVLQLTQLLAALHAHDDCTDAAADASAAAAAGPGSGGSSSKGNSANSSSSTVPPPVRRRRQQQRHRGLLLDQLHSGLAGGRLRPEELVRVPGLLAFLTDTVGGGGVTAAALAVVASKALNGGGGGNSTADWRQISERGVSAATGVALECICMLLSEEALPTASVGPCPELQQQLVAAVEAAVGVLRTARLPSAVNAPAHNHPATPPALPSWADGTAVAYGWSADVSAAFFAASVLVRAARLPALAEAAVAAGGLGLLVRLMGCRPPMLAQMAVFATYKLVRQSPPPPPQQQQPLRSAADVEREWREGALLAVAQCGGLCSLCCCLEALDDRPSRDMASSLLLDMALVPQVPSVVAGLGQVGALVRVMGGGGRDPISRMYALLVLARLCNHSEACQMDAVREGAVEPLLSLVRRGGEEEQTHACRLLAILAQAVPTHGRIKASGVVATVLPLLRATRVSAAAAVVAEHAASVLAVLSQNPDMHFAIVGAGGVPALVPLLSHGTDKARTYALACLMLLCEQEERHAAVVVRAGALSPLIELLAGSKAAADSSPAPRAAASAQEFAAAVICSLSRYVDIQAELVAYGALPALVRCLRGGPAEAAVNAAEALVHVTAGDAAAKRVVAGDAAAAVALVRLLSAVKPTARYWSLQLLRVISTDDAALRMLAGLRTPEDEEDGTAAAADKEKADEKGGNGIGRYGAELAAAAAEGAGGVSRAAELAAGLVRLLRWPEGQSGNANWQQGRCRVLAGWMLARLCGLSEIGPVLLAAGAVRELAAVLTEEQGRMAELAVAAAAAPPPPSLPLLPGEGEAANESGFEADEDEEGGAAPATGRGGFGSGSSRPGGWVPTKGAAAGGGGGRSSSLGGGGDDGGGRIALPRRMRFDMNAGAAAAAALVSVARTGQDGRTAVRAELALLHWMGAAVRLEGLDGRL